MALFHRLLVAVARDGTDAGLLRYARMAADLEPEAALHFVHVLGWSNSAQDDSGLVTHQQAHRELCRAVEEDFGRDSRILCSVLHGSRIDRLLEVAAETATDLILMGHRNGRGRRSLARRLAMKAPCSIWMAPEGSSPQIRRVAAAVDFSEPSARALSIATQIAQRLKIRECLALHVYLNESIAGVDEYRDTIRRRQQEAFSRFLAPLDLHGVDVKLLLEENPSVSKSVERVADAEKVDLIVMGTRGQSRSASVLLGSESEQMIMETRIPVLVVKHRGERIGLLQVLLDRDFHVQESPRFG